MIDAIALKTEISILLTGLLGTYTFSDGYVEPAIAVIPDNTTGYNYPDNGTVTTGMEVVIVRPIPTVENLLGGDRLKSYRWDIVLKQWSDTTSLLDATEALVNGLSHSIAKVSSTPPNGALGIIAQVRIELSEYVYQEVVGA